MELNFLLAMTDCYLGVVPESGLREALKKTKLVMMEKKVHTTRKRIQ